jgi:hypothetical protein
MFSEYIVNMSGLGENKMRRPYYGVPSSLTAYACHSSHQRLSGSHTSISIMCFAMNCTVYMGLLTLGAVCTWISAILIRYHFGLNVPVDAYLMKKILFQLLYTASYSS